MSPPSLRGLYHDPSTAWSFSSSPAVSAQQQPSLASPPASSTYQWKPPRNNNSIFDLSPSLTDGTEAVTPTLLFRSLVASAVLQYTSTAIAMPWEVGKLLLQVQWVPKEGSQNAQVGDEDQPRDEEEEEEMSECSNDDSYFADPAAGSSGPRKYPAPRLADEQGYVIRRSVHEDGTRPEFVIPVASADGVWGMIKRLARFRGEGWLALWKGLLTSSVNELISTTLQPLLLAALHSIFSSSFSSPFQPPSIILPVASHLLTGFMLSPLDLIRTRLIVQSFSSRHRAYTGPLDAMVKILREEGGLKGVYLHPHLLIPTLLDCTLRPAVSLAMPGLLSSYLHIHEETSHPLVWGTTELIGGCLCLLLSLPIETVRRRLQVQTRGTGKRIKTCVETRPVPYNGVIDCLWHVLTEERSDMGKDGKGKKAETRSWWSETGIGQLYRGFGMRVGASVVVFVLQMLGGVEEAEGWAEL